MATTAAKTESKPTQNTNILRLSNRTPNRKAMFISKIILKKHGSIQLESVGIATSEATKVAQMLVKHGYAKIKKIRTEQFIPESDRRRGGFQIKLFVNLEKTAEFDKLTEDIELRND